MNLKINPAGVCLILLSIFFGDSPLIFAQQTADQTTDNGISAPSPEADGSTYNYQADLFTGRFTYGIPITVAPGRQGAAPKIALGYNSAGGNGWCGVGWSLDTGYIQRDTRHGVPIAWAQAYQVHHTTNYFDYNTPLPQYDDSKGFISTFGGVSSTLVQVGSTTQNPIIYRQQVDTSFLTYEYFTNDYWEVIDKSGNIFFFGENTNCQMENSKTNWPQGIGSSTWRWALDRVIDVNGNETFLNYTLISGTLYLTNIMYNANTNAPTIAATDEVDFLLTNRPDTNFTFISGYRVTSSQLLSEIDVKAGGANVRKYVLGYSQSPSTLRSLLKSVTQYGSDFTSSLPPVTFNYQVQSFNFGPDTNWGPIFSQGQTNNANRSCIREVESTGDYQVEMVDIDGDGLPDRVLRENDGSYTNFSAERNTGSGFAFTSSGGSPQDYVLGTLSSQGQTGQDWNSPTAFGVGNQETFVDLIDINGDGYPDRVMREYSSLYTNFVVQENTGFISQTNSFQSDVLWTNVDDYQLSSDNNPNWLAVRYKVGNVDFLDMNGDGLPDRLSSDTGSPYQEFKVQLNTGSGFTRDCLWAPLDSQGQTDSQWNSISRQSGGFSGNDYSVIMADVNGDGLPDRVMRADTLTIIATTNIFFGITNVTYATNNLQLTNFVVQYNNGAGFEPAENWGYVDTQETYSNNDWGSPIATDDTNTWATLKDINGDGLPDRVMRCINGPYTNWVVQLNTGSGFGPVIKWGAVDGQGQPNNAAWNSITSKNNNDENTVVDFFDINGDGLPDRVMMVNNSPYTNFVVQLNQGPYPDLLNVVSNGLGGSSKISYIASTTLNNSSKDWTNDPWAEGAKSLLPFNVWVVSQIVTSDGMGNNSTNSYAFKGGYYNWQEKEFRGFSQCTQTDPLGTQTITYFHQSGGRDNSALGEYMDQGSESKKGIPFRIDLIGNDRTTNKITLNKVEEIELNSNGWYFPYIAQTIEMNYEGLSSCRATGKEFSYDTNTENLVEKVDLGEVTNVVVNGQTFTEVGSDSIYTWMTYTNFGKPSDIKITSDSAGADRLRESEMSYDSRGNLAVLQDWLNTSGNFITTTSISYDQYGNPIQATDAAGVTTYTAYDATYAQYPITQVIGTFTNEFVYDYRSGLTLQAIDAKGLVGSNTFDVFYRSTATYISTNAYGSPSLWQTKVSYSQGGIVGAISYNYTYSQVNDATDTNGFETYAYMDGLGRTIQTRTESEASGQFRVANIAYDLRGNAYFRTLPYFSSGTGFTSINGSYLGMLTEFDDVGRSYRVTAAVQGTFSSGSLTNTSSTGGDTGSPISAVTTAFVDGNNPWAVVVTDSAGKVKKSYFDAYGRAIQVTEVTSAGNYDTFSGYDLLGNLTSVTDNANNVTSMSYDSLGHKTSMTDPDLGTWNYAYDNAGRMTNQLDARSNKLTFNYNDPIGRLVSKNIYNSSGTLIGTIVYTYDVSDDPNYTVFKGQLYKVTDLQGYQRSSYDIRGRVTKTARFLNINAMEYVTQTTYDDADRVQTIIYPGNAATIQYNYDEAEHLVQVKSLAGTGTQEIFYTAQSFNAQDQLAAFVDGAGVVTTNIYFANSKRLQRVWAYNGTNNLQDLSYTYDAVSDLNSIYDGVYSSSASATISSISYDDLYRVTSVNSAAQGVKNYGYNSIGNVLTNQDFGSGVYSYGAKPHAVTSANGMTYVYDACGNMTTRGNQTLTYDEQNELSEVSTTNDLVRFGYDDAGERLWRCGTNGYSVWINGIYEINNGKVLCHVFAGGTRLATFEPQCGGLWSKAFGERNWYLATTKMNSITAWPFQYGRGKVTVFAGTWAAILGICAVVTTGRSSRKQSQRHFRPRLWKQMLSLISISAFIWASTPDIEAAPTYNPVFYYYHSNNVGSSNVLTDRSGQLVQHYEYATFGSTSYQNNTSAYPVSNRYTGQIIDDETGLYYYNARYYDSQLGRFIQPDTAAPSADSPQTLNRYSYCGNNPLKYSDPSGHFFFLIPMIIGAVVGAVSAAATGGNIGLGALTGAVSGLFGGLGGFIGGTLGGIGGGLAGSIVGGAIGGTISAEITHGDPGLGALTGAISGTLSFGVGQIQLPSNNYLDDLEGYTLSAGSGAVAGGIGASIEGGNFWEGAEEGAIGGAIGYDLETIASSWSNPQSDSNMIAAQEKYYWKLADATYSDTTAGLHNFPSDINPGTPPSGFDADFTTETSAYPPVVAYRGTTHSFADWGNDIIQALGFHSPDYAYASKLANQIHQKYPNVVFVGHSLGGGLAIYSSMATGGKSLAITFNAAGVHSFSGNGGNVVNFFIRDEPLTTLQDLLPIIPRATGAQIPYSFNPFGHGIANFPH